MHRLRQKSAHLLVRAFLIVCLGVFDVVVNGLDVFGFIEVGQHVLEMGEVIAFEGDVPSFAFAEVISALRSYRPPSILRISGSSEIFSAMMSFAPSIAF